MAAGDHMSSPLGVIIFILLMVLSLIVVGFADRVQTRNQLIRQKIQRMSFRIDELEEICTAIEPLLESVVIPKLINEEILGLINSVKQLNPRAASLDTKLERAQTVAQALEAGRAQPFNRVMPSDTAIAKHKYYLTEAARVVRRHQSIGRLQKEDMESYVRELAWAHLMVEVISHVVQGHKAISRDDPMVAFGYYRRAQNLLVGTLSADVRRDRTIRELGEILSGQRLALSADLMPETGSNPTAKPNFSGMDINQQKPVDGEYKAS